MPSVPVPQAIAQALGVRRGAGQSTAGALEQHLRQRQQLLLLDNFERLLEAGPPLARLLGACPRLKVLVTSRVVLSLRGEHRYEVPAMTLPPPDFRLSAEVDRYEGIHLFAERGPLQRVWLDRLEAEHDNLRAALEWSLTSQDDTELGLQLTGALSHFWYVHEHHNESRVWLQRALERGGKASDDAGAAARARVLVGAGRLAWFQGEFARVNSLAGEIQAPGDAARATSLFGAAETLLRSLDAALDPSGSLGYDGNLANARVRLGEEAFAKAWQRGRMMTLGQAMDEVAGDDP